MDASRRMTSRVMVPVACLSAAALLCSPPSRAQAEHGLTPEYVTIDRTDSEADIVRKAASIVPAPRQLAWQRQELTAFVHFGMNTFTVQEWGSGSADPALFNPSGLDAGQWVKVLKDAGMKSVILTAKHHDGFCLWPSKYTIHSVRSSPWRGGKGDVVAEVASACRSLGMRFGIYLSPWDRHESSYGDSPRYNEFFRNQLRELLTGYGDIAEVWFDGACGEGPNGKRQEYDWQSYYALIRELQPDAVIAVMGPDVRWVGTESGEGRLSEWSVIPENGGGLDSIGARSQRTALDAAYTPGNLMQEDLGSRVKILGARALRWYPSEADVSIRPGWFYRADQDDRVKPPAELVDLYFSSVGRNSVLLLNVPPDQRGRIHENDVKSLRGMRTILDHIFRTNLLEQAQVRESHPSNRHPVRYAIAGDGESFWEPENGGDSAFAVCSWRTPRAFDCAMLQEEIRLGQHVERFRVEQWDGRAWAEIARGGTIGEKRLLRFPLVTTRKVRFVIEQSRGPFEISALGVFRMPGKATF